MQYAASRAIPTAVKQAVLARDGMRCHWCAQEVVYQGSRGAFRPEVLHFDHVKPWASGGEHTVENLVPRDGLGLTPRRRRRRMHQ